MSSPSRNSSFTGAQLLCKNNCGFYGNIQWEGYCSLCRRKIQRAPIETLNEEVSPWFDLASVVSFEGQDKKKIDFKRTSLSNLFTSSTNNSPDSTLEKVPKSEQISRTVLVLVEKKTKDFINKHSKKNYTPDAFGDLISAFYDNLSELIKKKVDHDQEMIQICIDRAEDQLTDPLYARLFALEEDENQDLELQKAIRQFHWIGPAMLGARIDRSLSTVNDLIDQAVNYILQTNSELLPREKLRRLSSACDCIMKSLQASIGKPPGADDFMPALIFLLLHTNPPLFKSNLALIRRLSPPNNIRSGELAYYYVSICTAVAFIERGITEKDLNLTRHQFAQFVTNEVRPPHSLMDMDFSSYRNRNKIGDIFTQNSQGQFSSSGLERIHQLRQKNEEFFNRARQLRKEMSEFSISVSKEVEEIIEKYPLQVENSVEAESNQETESSSQTSQKSY